MRELRLEQAIKQIGNLNLKCVAILTRFSHAFLGRAEMRLVRWLRSLQWPGHCFSRISAAVPRFSVEASSGLAQWLRERRSVDRVGKLLAGSDMLGARTN